MTLPRSSTVSSALLSACRRWGRSIAIVDGPRETTYEELGAMVRSQADILTWVLQHKATKIAFCSNNSTGYITWYYAAVHAGKVPFLVDAHFGRHEFEEVHRGCGVNKFLLDRDAATGFKLPCQMQSVPGSQYVVASVTDGTGSARDEIELAENTATCRFTSGTSGRPKCLEFSHAAVLLAAEHWVTGTGLSQTDRTLCLAGLCNGLAFNTSLLPTFLAGGQLHLYHGLPSSRAITSAVRVSRATRLVAFPLIYRLLAEAPVPPSDEFRSLCFGISAGAPLPPEVRQACASRLGITMADYYGIAEAGPCTFERDSAWKVGLGTVLPGVDLKLAPANAGSQEVLVRTESMATRYLNMPGLFESALDSDGYLHTGDLGYIDGDRLFLTGRSDGPFNIDGRKVDPVEIEAVALRIVGVEDAAVLSRKDENGRHALHLVVASRRPLSRAEVVLACRSSLSSYKLPSFIDVVEHIPRSAAGKVMSRELQRRAGSL